MAKPIIILISCALGVALGMLLFYNTNLRHNNANRHASNEMMGSPQTPTSTVASPTGSGSAAINSTHNHILLLHRKKRYLLFPEGSSFQLVFDLIIPIVDYTNFAILGITCAVAWELPSKPPSEILDNLRTRLNDGTLGTVRRNDSIQRQQPLENREQLKLPPMDNGDYSPSTANWQSMHAQPTVGPQSTATYASNVHRYSYYTNVQHGGRWGDTSVYANSPNGQPSDRRPTNWHARQSMAKWRHWTGTAPPAASGGGSDNWWLRNKERVQQNWRQRQQQWNTYEQTTKSSYSYTQPPRQLLQQPLKHHIYPVFGKRRRRRSLDEMQSSNNDVIERLHVRQHLSSRGLLFGKIERLYRSKQLNGTACIQRALCESAQRQRDVDRPQSFIMELLSVIFQLPGSDDSEEALKHIPAHYLEAHGERGNCRQLFGDCVHTFWLE